MTDAVVVLQARLASTRLPRKALARIGPRTILARCLDRLSVSGVAPVVLATTDRPEDDVLADEAAAREIAVCRGPAEDVLQRFVLTANAMGARYVLRATADNPAVDLDAPRRVLFCLRASSVDYVREEGLPYGAAVEGITADALRRAADGATTHDDREHVTTYLRRTASFSKVILVAPAPLRRPDLRLTVDTADDLEYMRRLYARLGYPAGQPDLALIIAAADALARDVADRRSSPPLGANSASMATGANA